MNTVHDRAVAFFCRHLVGLAVVYRHVSDVPSKPSAVNTYSGTLLLFGDGVSWLTAGHVVAEISEMYTRSDIQVVSCSFIDMFGHEATHRDPIPFVWATAPKAFLDEDGLDFGVVSIAPFYVKLLVANGAKAIDERNWKVPDDLDVHFIVGFPKELASPAIASDNTIAVTPVLQRVQKLDASPDEAEFAPVANPLFYGRILGNALTSVKGMSGGPIIGMRSRDPGVYWIVALQRSQKGRFVTGCPVPVAGAILLDSLTRARADAEQT